MERGSRLSAALLGVLGASRYAVLAGMAHALLVANLCDLEHRLSLGTNDKMQLAGMVGLFQTSRPSLKSA